MPITYQGPHVNTLTLTFSEHDIVAMFPVDFPRTILLKRYIACLTAINNQSDEELEALHIPADHEHQFRFNVNTISGPM